MKKSLIAFACLCAATVFADVSQASVATNSVPKKKPTPQELQKLLAVVRMKKTGGFVRKEGSAKGTFVVLNCQKRIAEKEIRTALATLDRQVKVQTKLAACASVGVNDVREKIRSAGGTVGVALVESDTLPSLLAAPETGWAIVNVTAITAGADDKDAAARLRKEVLRGFAFVAGGCYSPFGDFLMRDIVDPKNLDVVPNEEFSIAALQRFSQSLGRYKITPWYETTYLKACEEGWAPASTNEYQKAIWDKVHAVPQKPMKIEFDPKKGR